MRAVVSIVVVLLAVTLQAQVARVAVGSHTVVNAPGATATYSLDSDCAEAALDDGKVIVTGVRTCTTHVVIVNAGGTDGFLLIVTPRQQQIDAMNAARLRMRGIAESGSVATSYISDPAQWGTEINLARTEGSHAANVSLTFADGYGYSRQFRRATLPRASLEFSSASSKLVLFDSYVDRGPLALDGVKLRGIHFTTSTWFVHAGISSITNFRSALLEKDADVAVLAGYRSAIGQYSSITPSIQWIHASPAYLSGRSGVIGSLQYAFDLPGRLHFESELSVNRGIALGSRVEYNTDRQHLQLRIRSAPPRFAAMSTSAARGFQAEGVWSRQLSADLSLNVSGSRNVYTRFDGASDSNVASSARLQWRFSKLTLGSGIATSRITRQNEASIDSVSLPVSMSVDTRHFGNSFQYQFTKNNLSERGAHWLRDSVRLTFRSLSVSAYAGRQTQAPTMEYILDGLPSLRQALLSAGAAVSTPEEIQLFLASHSDLIAGGFLHDFHINLSPEHRFAGASANWRVARNKMEVHVESRVDEDRRVGDRVFSTNNMASLSLRAMRHTDIVFSASIFTTRTGLVANRSPVLSLGLRRQLGDVPDSLNRLQERGRIHGMVFTDDGHLGAPAAHSKGLAGITVVLDEARRTQTNTQGQYSFGSVPEGMHTVEVQYAGIDPVIFTSSPRVDTRENTTVDFGIAQQKPRLVGTVRSDAGLPIPGVAVHITGPAKTQARTSEHGIFTVELPVAGVYDIDIDPESLPPSYSLNDRLHDDVDVKRGQAADVDFVVRALRSVSGRIVCGGKPLEREQLALNVDGKTVGKVFSEAGIYTIRDMRAGTHEFVLRSGDVELKKVVDVSSEPVSIRGVDFDICSPTARQ